MANTNRRGQATSSGQVAKKTVAKTLAKKTPAKDTAASQPVAKKPVAKKAGGPPMATQDAAGGVTAAISAQMAKRPPAGAGLDPEDRKARSFHLSRQLVERLRAVVYWSHVLDLADIPTNSSEFVENVIRDRVEEIERTHNGGRPFPEAPQKMQTGPGVRGLSRLVEYQDRRREQKGKDGDDG
ncbi:MAG TPA: hypothetical protein VGF00_11150 [Acidimicrobiia bacterium]|jgi:hypothetical protein